MTTKLKIARITAAAAVAAIATAAQAGSVTFTAAPIPLASVTTLQNANLQFQQYDASQYGNAALLSVVFSLSGQVQGRATITNYDTSAHDFDILSQAKLTLTTPDKSTVLAQVIPAIDQVVNVAADTSSDGSGTRVSYTSPLTTLGTTSATITDPGILALFAGTGYVAAPLGFTSQSRISTDSPSFDQGIRTFAGGNGSITYNYADPAPAAVPEVGTWAMMLLGFGAMGFAMRRRRPVVTFG